MKQSTGAQLFGSVFMVVGVACALFVPTSGRLTCERARDHCLLSGGSLLFQSERYFPIEQLRGARVAEQEGDEGGSTCRLELQVGGAQLPLVSTWSTCGAGHEEAAGKIRAFMREEALTLEVEEGLGWGFFVFCGLFVLAGLIAFLTLGQGFRGRR